MDVEETSAEAAVAAIDGAAKIRRTKSVSPTQRSIARLESGGFIVAIVEHFNPYAKIRQDLFGFADLLAVGHGKIVAIQTTTKSNGASRRAKIQANRAAETWVRNGGFVELWLWNGSELTVENYDGKTWKRAPDPGSL